MSSSYRSNRLGLSHWDPYAVRRGHFKESMIRSVCRFRLYHSNTLPRQPSVILCAIHVSSLISALGRLYGFTAASSHGLLVNLYDFVATTMLVVCLMNSMVYEDSMALDTRSVCCKKFLQVDSETMLITVIQPIISK